MYNIKADIQGKVVVLARSEDKSIAKGMLEALRRFINLLTFTQYTTTGRVFSALVVKEYVTIYMDEEDE